MPDIFKIRGIHKEGKPLWPIISSVGSGTYNLARFQADIIGYLAGKTKHKIKNSADFLKKVKDILVLDDETNSITDGRIRRFFWEIMV